MIREAEPTTAVPSVYTRKIHEFPSMVYFHPAKHVIRIGKNEKIVTFNQLIDSF